MGWILLNNEWGLQTELSYSWALCNNVSAARSYSWSIYALVQKTLSYSWAIWGTVAKALSYSWRIINNIGKSLPYSWDILSFLGSSKPMFSFRNPKRNKIFPSEGDNLIRGDVKRFRFRGTK